MNAGAGNVKRDACAVRVDNRAQWEHERCRHPVHLEPGSRHFADAQSAGYPHADAVRPVLGPSSADRSCRGELAGLQPQPGLRDPLQPLKMASVANDNPGEFVDTLADEGGAIIAAWDERLTCGR